MFSSRNKKRKSLLESQDITPIKKEKKANTEENIIRIGAATVRFTKSLLAYGAENNWMDVKQSEGRSWNAAIYRQHWLYMSKKQRNKSSSTQHFLEDKSAHFFYSQPIQEQRDSKNNYIARKAACAVLTRSGACDEHAYVATMLLRKILPLNTQINLCAFINNKTGEDYPHTFIVIGPAVNEGDVFDKKTLENYKKNNTLFVVDSWVIHGGIVRLKDYWLREELDVTLMSPLHLSLKVNTTFYADQKDHLIKRVNKQTALIKEVIKKTEKLKFFSNCETICHHELVDQKDITKIVKPLHEIEQYRTDEDMWHNLSIADSYQEPIGTRDMMLEILSKYLDLKKLLEDIDEELENQVALRINSGLPSI